MANLTRNEGIAVGVALVVVLGALFFGSYVFRGGSAAPAQTTNGPSTAGNANNGGSSGLLIQDIKPGAGASVKAGDTVSVNYVGALPDGTVFDSSSAHGGQPLTFTVGSGQLIKGFDEGVIGMQVGGERKITIPPDLGYGAQAVGPIPANSTLLFDITLVKIGQ